MVSRRDFLDEEDSDDVVVRQAILLGTNPRRETWRWESSGGGGVSGDVGIRAKTEQLVDVVSPGDYMIHGKVVTE